MRVVTIELKRKEINTTNKVPAIKIIAGPAIRRHCPDVIPKEIVISGFIKGATIIAPMITAVLFAMSPSQAMTAEMPSIKKKLSVGNAPSIKD